MTVKSYLKFGAAAVVAMTAFFAEAKATVADVINQPSAMASAIRSLKPGESSAFLAEVNAALAKLPGSPADKAAKALTINAAAVKAVDKKERAEMLAQVFATAPIVALPAIVASFAENLFSRTSDPDNRIGDEKLLEIATQALANLHKKTASADDAAVRETFEIVMFLKISGGTPENLQEKLVATIGSEKERELAVKEWIPAALSDPADYGAMLAYADAVEAPLVIVLRLAGPQYIDALLADLSTGFAGSEVKLSDSIFRNMQDLGIDRIPRTRNKDAPFYPGDNHRGSGGYEPNPEPKPYLYQ